MKIKEKVLDSDNEIILLKKLNIIKYLTKKIWNNYLP